MQELYRKCPVEPNAMSCNNSGDANGSNDAVLKGGKGGKCLMFSVKLVFAGKSSFATRVKGF